MEAIIRNKHIESARMCFRMSDEDFWPAVKDIKTGLTLLWMKWKSAVKSKQRFLQIRENRFSGSSEVRPVCSASMKNKMALTEATDFSSSFSEVLASKMWKKEPT